MKKHLLLVTALLIGCFSAFSQGPSITSIDPASGMPGAVVTITGTNLGQVTAVRFGGTAARSFTVISETAVSAVIGAGSSGAVEVFTADSSASFPGFTFIPPSLTLTRISDGTEDGQAVQFRVSYPEGYVPADATTVNYELSGTAGPGTDFSAVSGTVQIPAGAESALIELAVTDDQVLEGAEEVSIGLVSASSGDIPLSFDPQATVSASVEDNDTGAALSVAVQNNGSEPGTNLIFRISFPPGVTSSVPTQVTYQAGGSATAGADYAALSGTLVLPAGANAADLVVDVADDTVFEGPEIVTITLVAAANTVAAISVQGELAEAVLTDDEEDPASQVLTLSLLSAGAEGGSPVRFRVSFPQGITRSAETTVSYTIGGTAVAGTDHSGSTGTLVIPPGAGSADIEIPVTEDLVIEGAETVTVTLTRAVSAGTELPFAPAGPVTAQVTDNDDTPIRNRISVVAVADGAEPAAAGRFEVRFPPGVTSSAGTTVTYQAGGSAAPGTDYTSLPGTVVIPAGSNSAAVTVSVLDDEVFEGDETVQLTLLSASGIADPAVDNQAATVTITENDEDPATNVITLTAQDDGAEGGDAVRFRISYPQGIVRTFNTTVSYAVTGTAVAGTDYTAVSGSLVIPAGQNFADLVIPVTDDQVIEPAETLVVSLRSASVPPEVTTVVTVGQDPVTARVTDNDNTAANNRITLAAVSDAAEPASGGRFEVRFPAGITSSVATTVTYQAGGSAAPGADYTSLPGTVTIPAGANAVNLEIAVLDDQVMEGNEVISVSLRGASNAISTLTVTDTPESVTLSDNDNRAPFNIVSLSRVRDGGEPGTSPGFRIGFPENITSSSPATVTFSIGGTATSGTDYAQIPGQVVIPAGENAVFLNLSVTDDQVIEGAETVILALTAATSANTLLTVGSGAVFVTISDNDQTARNQVLTLVKESDAAEAGTDAVFLLRYPEGIVSAAATSVTYTIGGTATNGSDYAMLTGTAAIPAGANSTEIRVAVTDDQEIEITETVALTLQGATSAAAPALTLGTTSSVIANIADNDGSSANTITLAKAQDGAEPASNPIFRVSFPAGVSSSAVTIVSYAVGGSAGNGADFRTLPGSVIIPAGRNSADIIVTVLDDQLVDRDETVELTLTSASNSVTALSIFPATPVAALIRDDDVPAITSFSPSAGPAGSAVTISGARFDSRPENNLVFFGTVQGTVTAATPGSLTVTVPAGATYQPLTVTVGGLSARSATSFNLTFPNDAGIDPRGFASRTDLPLEQAASYLAAGDLNGDRRIDLLTTHYRDRMISVFTNGAEAGGLHAGSFAGPRQFPANGNPVHAIIHDLDGDGRPDAVVVSEVISAPDTTFLLSVYRNTSTADSLNLSPVFELPLPGGVPAVDVADMNGDGQPDLLTLSASDPVIRIFTGTPGAMTFQPAGTFAAGTAPRGLVARDLNGDGKADMAVADQATDRILVFVNTGSGAAPAFAPAVAITAAGGPAGITATDVNRDGRPDLAVMNGAGLLRVLMNSGSNGAVNFVAGAELAAAGRLVPVSAGDLDGDGRADLVVVPGDSVAVSAFRNTGTAAQSTFSGPLGIGAGSARGPVRIADMDGDSKPELVMIGPGDSTISILQNTSDQPVLFAVSPLTACVGSTVTLTGSNLNGATAVSFGGVPAASFTVVSSTSITVLVPPGAGAEIAVTTPKGTARRGGFTPVPVPGIAVSGSTTFQSGGQVILTATTGDGYRYVWQKDGADLSGAGGSTYTARESGSYRVRILDGNCGAVSEPVAVTVIFTLPPANFAVSATAATCRGTANGEIRIDAALQLDYTATITGAGKNLSTRFDKSARFDELAAGTYNICLTVAGQPDYRLCYDVVVSEPQDLAVYTAVSPAGNALDLVLSGSDVYYVELNGETQTVRRNQVTLGLKPGANLLKVSTGRDCQGVVERVIVAGTLASVFPNPFENILNLSLPGQPAADATIRILNQGGKVVYSGKFVSSYGNIRMDLPDLAAGVYFLKLSTGGTESVYKIIRK